MRFVLQGHLLLFFKWDQLLRPSYYIGDIDTLNHYSFNVACMYYLCQLAHLVSQRTWLPSMTTVAFQGGYAWLRWLLLCFVSWPPFLSLRFYLCGLFFLSNMTALLHILGKCTLLVCKNSLVWAIDCCTFWRLDPSTVLWIANNSRDVT